MNTAKDVAAFEKQERQLHVFLKEIENLSSKKPHEPVNKFKLQFINACLRELNRLLNEDRPLEGFEQFDIDVLPSNSDVAMILSQYVSSAFKFREEHTKRDPYGGKWHWYHGSKAIADTEDDYKFKYKND